MIIIPLKLLRDANPSKLIDRLKWIVRSRLIAGTLHCPVVTGHPSQGKEIFVDGPLALTVSVAKVHFVATTLP